MLADLRGLAAASPSSLTKHWQRRWGRRIHKRGHYRDSLASSRSVPSAPWATLDRADPGRHTALERPPLGLMTCRRQRRRSAKTQDHRPVDAPDDPGGATLAAQRRHHRAGRSSLQRRGTRPCLPTLWGASDCSPVSMRSSMKRRQRVNRAHGVVRLSRANACRRWQGVLMIRRRLGMRWYDGGVRCLQVSSGSQWAAAPAAQMDCGPAPSNAYFSTCPSDQAGDIVWSIETRSRKAVLTWALRSVNGRTWRLNA